MRRLIAIITLLTLAYPAYATDTGFQVPASNAADTSSAGDNNGFEGTSGTVPTDVSTSNDGYITDTNSGTSAVTDGCTSITQAEDDAHEFTDFSLSIPSGAIIEGIEVQVEGKADSTTGTPVLCVGLSPDAGTSWTRALSSGTLTTGDVTYTYGGSTNPWGRIWSDTEFSDANFILRVEPDGASSNTLDYSVDYVAVKVYYRTTGTHTGYVFPTTNPSNPDTWTNPSNMLTNNATNATGVAPGSDSRYDAFGFAISSTATINGIAVECEAANSSGVGTVEILHSWDNGTSHTSGQDLPDNGLGNLTTAVIAYTNGGPADLWGRSWTPAEFNDGTYLLRVGHSNSAGTFAVDYCKVDVWYTDATPGVSGGKVQFETHGYSEGGFEVQ